MFHSKESFSLIRYSMQPSSLSCWTTSTWSPLKMLQRSTMGHQLPSRKWLGWRTSRAGQHRTNFLPPTAGRRRLWLYPQRKAPPCSWLEGQRVLAHRWTQRWRGWCKPFRHQQGRSSWRSHRRRTWESKHSWSMWEWRSFPAEGRTDTLAILSLAQSEYDSIR